MPLDESDSVGKPEQNLRAVRLPSLSFDSSNSAMARFYGPMAELTIHWPSGPAEGGGTHLDQRDLFCPMSFRDLVPLAYDLPKNCLACGKLPSAPRRISLAWDLSRGQWCTFVGHPFTFDLIRRAGLGCGATPKMMVEGLGPDMLLQRIGRNTSCLAMTETMGQPKSWPTPPLLVTVLIGIMRRSLWDHMTPEEATREGERRAQEREGREESPPRMTPTISVPLTTGSLRMRISERISWTTEPRQGPPSIPSPRPSTLTPKKTQDDKDAPQDDLRVKDRWDLL